jgi:hypothetical protein
MRADRIDGAVMALMPRCYLLISDSAEIAIISVISVLFLVLNSTISSLYCAHAICVK